MLATARRSSTALIVTGVIALIFGLVASFWPVGTALSLVVMWGAYALVDGVTALILAFSRPGAGAKAWLVFTGILGILAGLFGIFQPVASGVALAWVLGIWLMARGISEFIGAFAKTISSPRWLLLLGGVAWFIAGILFALNPGAAALTIAFWLGAFAIAWGLLSIGAGIALRSHAKKSGAQAPA